MKKRDEDLFPMQNLSILENGYLDKIDNDSKYSIEVDPENKYHFSKTQKDFIANYIQFKNIPLAAKLTDIEEELALSYYNSYAVKMEIRRINLALYHRAFATRMLGIDEVGGYLTSVLIGENIAEADKIGTRDKIQVAKMIIELNKMKQESLTNPDRIIDVVDVQEELSKLSVETIQKMISSSKKTSKQTQNKNEVIEEINEINNGLTTEELNHLKTLPTSELLNILEQTNQAIISDAKEEEEILEEENNILKNKIKEYKKELPKNEDEEDEDIEEDFSEDEMSPSEKVFAQEKLDEASGDSNSINDKIKSFFERQAKKDGTEEN